jgi:hypothetical protein
MNLDDLAADALRRCSKGELSPAITVVRLLIAYGDLDRFRSALTAFSADDRPADRAGIARVQRLLATNPEGSAQVLAILEEERAMAAPDEADQVERCRRLFDRLVGESPEASVALYSLGDPRLLDAATCEVVLLLDRLAVLGPERRVLEIGCGIGRFQQALAHRVAAITASTSRPG